MNLVVGTGNFLICHLICLSPYPPLRGPPSPCGEGIASYRYSNIVLFPLSMPLLVLRTTFPPKGGTETLAI